MLSLNASLHQHMRPILRDITLLTQYQTDSLLYFVMALPVEGGGGCYVLLQNVALRPSVLPVLAHRSRLEAQT